MALETVTVEKVNEFGIRSGDKQFNYSPKFNGTKLNTGEIADVEVYTSPKGAKYINKVVKVNTCVTGQSDVPHVQEASSSEFKYSKKKFVPKATSSEDAKWDKVNRGKVKSLFIEAILSNPNMVSKREDLDLLNEVGVQASLDRLVESVF